MKGKKIVPMMLGGAVVTLLVWVLRQWAHVEVPGEVAAAMGVVATALISIFTPDALEADE